MDKIKIWLVGKVFNAFYVEYGNLRYLFHTDGHGEFSIQLVSGDPKDLPSKVNNIIDTGAVAWIDAIKDGVDPAVAHMDMVRYYNSVDLNGQAIKVPVEFQAQGVSEEEHMEQILKADVNGYKGWNEQATYAHLAYVTNPSHENYLGVRKYF